MYPRVEGDVSEEEQVSDSIKKVHIQFEQNWQEISRVYGLMLHPKTLKVMKGEGMKSKTFWLPRSVVHEDSDVQDEGDEGELFVHRWYFDQEGL